MQLTPEQQQIIAHDHGHARVSAVAGSGKTTTMIARIGQLLERGVPAAEMMVLMFNRSARDAFESSMRRRLSAQTLPEIRTFHSLGWRLVGSFTRRGALPECRFESREFLLERMAKAAATEAWRRSGGEGRGVTADQLEEFLAFIDLVKGAVEGPEAVIKSLESAAKLSWFVEAYNLFEEQRRREHLRFYADLIADPLTALAADEALVAWVANRVSHIIVDEYQDINESQQQLLKYLAGERAEVMVVGDVDQCIYEWRGAKPEYIVQNFAFDFQGPHDYTLSHTFRYGHRLSLAANHLIANNLRRDSKLCISHPGNAATELQLLAESPGGRHPIVAVLEEWKKAGRSLSEAAVLVRLYAQSVAVELALLGAGVPYRLEGAADLFGCTEIVALLGYLRLAAWRFGELERQALEETLSAMLNQPHPGIKKGEVEKLRNAILPLLITAPEEAAAHFKREVGRKLPPFIQRRLEELGDTWSWLITQEGEAPAAPLLKSLVERLELYDFYHSISTRTVTAENRVKTCEALIAFAAGDELSVNALLDRIEEFRSHGGGREGESLLLTSVHRAKGLEWPLVVLPGLEEGSFPFFKDDGEGEMEDERRLFYVAITRAVEKLVCIHPQDARLKKAMAAGRVKRPAKKVRASRFLYEANLGLCDRLGGSLEAGESDCRIEGEDLSIVRSYLASIQRDDVTLAEKKPAPQEVQRERLPLTAAGVQEGMEVFHPVWGEGRVVKVNDRSAGRITAFFEEEGEVILLLKFARLEALQEVEGQ